MAAADEAVSEWKALTPDGGVMKKVMCVAAGDAAGHNAKVSLRYSLTLAGSTTPFDASTARPNGCLKFVLGKRKVIRGLELLAASMASGEVALGKLSPDYAFGSKGLPRFSVPPNATVEVELEMVHIEPQEKSKGIAEMTSRERFEEATRCKERGNTFFKEGKVEKAASEYQKCLRLVDYIFYRPKQSGGSGNVVRPSEVASSRSVTDTTTDVNLSSPDAVRLEPSESSAGGDVSGGPKEDEIRTAFVAADIQEVSSEVASTRQVDGDITIVLENSGPIAADVGTFEISDNPESLHGTKQDESGTGYVVVDSQEVSCEVPSPRQVDSDVTTVVDVSTPNGVQVEPADISAHGEALNDTNEGEVEGGFVSAEIQQETDERESDHADGARGPMGILSRPICKTDEEEHSNAVISSEQHGFSGEPQGNINDDPDEEEVGVLHVAALNNMALCMLKLGENKKTEQACTLSISLDPTSHKPFFYRGRARVALGNWEEAKADLLAAAKLAPKSMGIRVELEKLNKKLKAHRSRERKAAAAIFE